MKGDPRGIVRGIEQRGKDGEIERCGMLLIWGLGSAPRLRMTPLHSLQLAPSILCRRQRLAPRLPIIRPR